MAAVIVAFRRSSYPFLYWSASGVGYLLPAGATGPDTIELKYSWTTFQGCYLLVGEPVPPAQAERFAGQVRTFLAAPGMDGTRFAWFADPNVVSGQLTGPALTFAGPPDGHGTAVLRTTTQLNVGGLELVLTAGATVSLADDRFDISPATGACYLVGPDGVKLDVVEGASSLDLGGPAPAAIHAELRLGQTAGVDDLAHIDAGFRIFFPRPGSDGGIDSRRHPLVATGATVAVVASLDPTAPLDPARTSLGFTGGDTIASCFITNTGQPYALTPTADSSLIFAPRPTGPPDGAAPGYYLTPSGTFVFDRPGSDLMCGLSGVEYLKLPASGPSIITFTPGRPAYAGGTHTVPLSALATTSWASVECQGQPITYCAQPDDATLYLPSNKAGRDFAALDYLEVPAATLPANTQVLFPLLPYDGMAAADTPGCAALEAGAIAPTRHKVINDLGPPPPAPDADASAPGGVDLDLVVGVTPQGLLARFTPDFRYMAVTLGRSVDGTELALDGIPVGTAMWSALQCNQMFLVISDPACMRSYLKAPNAQLRADGWTFDLDPAEGGGWRPIDGEQPTFLVLKFNGQSFRELAASPGSWVQAADFNAGDPATASAKLSAYVEDAIARATHDPNLAWFSDTVLQDPSWNGVVALNCPAPIDGWPAQLQGLAAGIDATNLVAHHAGVQVTPVTTTAESVSLETSSIFGLIEYHDPEPFPQSPAPYDFKVSRLEVPLVNSYVAGFAGEVFLQVNELFDEPAECVGVVDNNLVFNGTYQAANGEGSYAFVLSDPSRVRMTSAVLEWVELERAEFVTAAKPAPDGTIAARFQLWGTMAFRPLEAFDAFGFDALRFAGLAIDMAVTPSITPGLPPAKEMAFDAGHVAFDVDASIPRSTSLYEAFHLELTGLVQAGSGYTDPTDLGYVPVSTPIAAGELGAPWFGLVFQLVLGSRGAWAPAGSFSAGLLVAWGRSSDDEDDANVFVGLQLPGTTGGQLEMALEGPLNIGLKHVAFEVTNGAYVLWMQSLVLGLFGLSFPPGRTDILLFAPGDGSRTLGWYGVYDKGSTRQAGGNQKQVGA